MSKLPGLGSLCLVFTLVIPAPACWGDWISDNGSLNLNSNLRGDYPSIAISNNTPYVTWRETDGTHSQIYVKHFNGNSWVQDGGSLNVNTGQNASDAIIAISNNTPYVTWRETNGTCYQIYVKHFNGNSWVHNGGSLNDNMNLSAVQPYIAFYNTTPYVTWQENASPHQIYVKHYNGSSWLSDGESLNANTANSAYSPTMAFSNETPFVTWYEAMSGKTQIYVKHFNGSSWISDGGSLNVNVNSAATNPVIAMLNATPYVAWHEFDTGYLVFVKHYNGSNWIQDGAKLNVTNLNAFNPALAISNGTPYVAWHEFNGSRAQVYVKHFNGSAWLQDGESLNVNTLQDARVPDIAFSGNTPYVTWYEDNVSEYHIYVKHFLPPITTITPTVLPTLTPITPAPTVLPTLTPITPAPTVLPTLTPITPAPTVITPQPASVRAFPNPANERVLFIWQATGFEKARIDVYNVAGKHEVTLKTETSAGQQLIWDAKRAAPGVYFYRLILTIQGMEKKSKFKKISIRH